MQHAVSLFVALFIAGSADAAGSELSSQLAPPRIRSNSSLDKDIDKLFGTLAKQAKKAGR